MYLASANWNFVQICPKIHQNEKIVKKKLGVQDFGQKTVLDRGTVLYRGVLYRGPTVLVLHKQSYVIDTSLSLINNISAILYQ